jgi:hypothetical protein
MLSWCFVCLCIQCHHHRQQLLRLHTIPKPWHYYTRRRRSRRVGTKSYLLIRRQENTEYTTLIPHVIYSYIDKQCNIHSMLWDKNRNKLTGMSRKSLDSFCLCRRIHHGCSYNCRRFPRLELRPRLLALRRHL